MSRQWRPGDVAVVTFADGREVTATRYDTGVESGWWTPGLDRYHADRGQRPARSARPLVVIDPEGLPVDDLIRALDRWRNWTSLTHEGEAVTDLIEAITEATRDPKPDEPTGLPDVPARDGDGVPDDCVHD